jgi:hypothetical protein
MLIRITSELMERACYLEERFERVARARTCPVALAMGAAGLVNAKATYSFLMWDGVQGGILQNKTPRIVSRFMKAFDTRGRAIPFEFEISI